MKLTNTQIKAAKPKDKAYTLTDGQGLSLLINTNGSKWWRFRYRFDSKQKMLSLGTYPEVSLATARKKLIKAREQVAAGTNPSDKRKEKKEALVQEAAQDRYKTEHSFEVLARSIMDKRLEQKEISYPHHKRTITALENDAFPIIGKKQAKDITPEDIEKIIAGVVDRGAKESARKLFYMLGKIFKKIKRDSRKMNLGAIDIPTEYLTIEDLGCPKSNDNHYPCITDKKGLKGLLGAINGYTGSYSTKMAMRLLPHIFLRSLNIRHLEWDEIDFDDKFIRIQGSKMKTKSDFIIPMSRQVIELLKEVEPFTGQGRYVFPSLRDQRRPMSDNTMIAALRRMGITKEEFVPHSWRSVFATIANEQGQSFEAIEASLAHTIGSTVSRSYNRAIYLEQRKELYQWWSDWLDEVQK